MKMTVETAVFGKALYRVQGIADKKSSKPILTHVLLDASAGGDLTVAATDLDVGLSGVYPAVRVDRPGQVALHAKHLHDVVKALPPGTVDLELQDNHWVELRGGSSRFRLVGMPGDEFPEMPNHEDMTLFSVPQSKLMQMIDRTLFCVSTDDNRYNLSGIYCEAGEGNTFRMVATDGHRLAMAESPFEQAIAIERGVIVPRKGFQELRRVLSDSAETIDTVSLGFSSTNGVIKAGSVTLSTRLVDGQFPDYEQVIPKASDKHARIPRVPFAEALRRVSLLSQGRAYGVKLALEPGRLQLLAEDPEYGDAEESIDVEYTGEKLVVGFNARYLLDVLGLIPEQGVRFDLADDLSPAVLRPLEDAGFLAIVMPMRI